MNTSKNRFPMLGLRAARIASALLVAAAATLSQAQTWPAKPIRVVVPFTPGGPTDILARAITQRLSQSLGQQFIVDNKAGAGGTVGTAEVARAPADGYTVLFTTSSTHAISPHLMKLAYNPLTDFTAIAQVAEAPMVLLVPTSLEVKSVGELIALARQKPGRLNYATSGNGTIPHLTMEAFKARAGLDVLHVPYKGGAPALPDLMTGSVHMIFNAMPGVMEQVKTGRIRALALTSPKRSPLAPDLPTVAESGLPGFSSVVWFGFYGPKGMNADVVKRMNDEVNALLRKPEVVASLAALGAEPGHGTAADFAAMVARDSEHWKQIIVERKITVD